jgi:hypothetical protein
MTRYAAQRISWTFYEAANMNFMLKIAGNFNTDILSGNNRNPVRYPGLN